MKKSPLFFLILLLTAAIGLTSQAQNGIYRANFAANGRELKIEILDDDLLHFELNESPNEETIWTTPMIAKTDYTGAQSLNVISETHIETADLRLEIDTAMLCVQVTDISRNPELVLSNFCPSVNDRAEINGLAFSREGTTDIYGLGEQFERRGGTEGNWIGRRRRSLSQYGNAMTSFNGGNVGNAQFPILYALGANTDNYALFLDHVYPQYWDLTKDPFLVQTADSPLRWYVFSGADLPDLRSDYLELTGRPPVPPKQMFGLWVSEYGYDNWDELNEIRQSLQAANFPVDGYVMDLQWFGGIRSRNSQMGSIAWDEVNFPNPEQYIADLRQAEGAGLMVIEESYLSQKAVNYAESIAAGVALRACGEADCSLINMVSWWGTGGMIDWTNPEASAWWHDNRRQALIDMGIMGHWTDLGEPEDFSENSWYYGIPELGHDQASVHNLYNFMWSQSIWEGYQRNQLEQRPFILSRSGTAGSQRFGVAMWSGDIGANMPSLDAQMNVQMQMSLSGIDYFGSDIGGFYRQAADPLFDANVMYSLWFANSALLDVPVRPHTANTNNIYHTAPSLIGDVASNLANIRLRYALSPYLYSAAHRAYQTGEAVFAPLVYYFQTDPTVRTIGAQKMLGADMMMATVTGYQPSQLQVYLPAGTWFDYYTHERFESSGQWIERNALRNAIAQAPLFVRGNAIIPMMYVDEQTQTLLGQRRDGTTRDELILSIYGNESAHEFSLMEDDGITMAYQNGAIRSTSILQTPSALGSVLMIAAAEGTYDSAPETRTIEVRLIAPSTEIQSVLLNGEALVQHESLDAFKSAESGWIADSGVIYAKAPNLAVTGDQQFTFVSES